jgi:hypothetical protein
MAICFQHDNFEGSLPVYYRQHDDDHFNLPCQFKCPLTPHGPNIFWKKPNRKNLDS